MIAGQLTVEIAIISDTHLPRGARRLPDACVERLRAADVIVHAGDLSTLDVLEELSALGPPVVAVHGNVDDAAVRAALPATAVLEAGGARVAVDPRRRRRAAGRLGAAAPPVPATPTRSSSATPTSRCTSAPTAGFQIFNPGSPTERRRAPHHTMGVGRAVAGTLTFELDRARLSYVRARPAPRRAIGKETPQT